MLSLNYNISIKNGFLKLGHREIYRWREGERMLMEFKLRKFSWNSTIVGQKTVYNTYPCVQKLLPFLIILGVDMIKFTKHLQNSTAQEQWIVIGILCEKFLTPTYVKDSLHSNLLKFLNMDGTPIYYTRATIWSSEGFQILHAIGISHRIAKFPRKEFPCFRVIWFLITQNKPLSHGVVSLGETSDIATYVFHQIYIYYSIHFLPNEGDNRKYPKDSCKFSFPVRV